MKKYKRNIVRPPQQKKTTKKDKRILNLFWGLSVFFVLHYLFFERYTLGHDHRYIPYIVVLPTLIGMIIAFILHFKSYKNDLIPVKKWWNKCLFTLVYLFLLILPWGFLGFGQFAAVAWNYINKRTAAENPRETFYCDVDDFWFSKNCNVQFHFQNRKEYLNVAYKDIKMYKNILPNRYQIEVTVQKGIWNYYILKHWDIVEKSDSSIIATP